MYVLDYVAHETERQSGTVREGLGMYVAHNYVQRLWREGRGVLSEVALIHMYQCIKNATDGYRTVPVVFNQGLPGLAPTLIPNAMKRLTAAMAEPQDASLGYKALADMYTREFLLIHPFTDGNGRVASLMWNSIRGSIINPEPMPYFFGEN